MLEVSTLPSPSKAAEHHAGGFLPTSSREDDDCFMVPDDSLLDYIDFTACCDVVPSFFDADGDILPDLEVDPATEELLAEFETTRSPAPAHHRHHDNKENKEPPPPDDDSNKKTNEVLRGVTSEDSTKSSASAEGQSNNKQKTTSKPSTKNSHGSNKKKAKVEWTPELHRKFVQAVEQLGIDKAVPSRILEIMGSQCCLTRHNIASHLQKYRSHRKHVMAREAEAATWAQKRQMYAPMQTNKDMTTMPPPPPPLAGPCPWVVPTTIIGFPPPPPPFGVRPLHVWGHPPAGVEAPAVLPVWPRHLLPRPWVYWQQQQYNNNAARKWGPTQCVPPPPAAVMLPRFPAPGMTMYRPASPPQSSKRLHQLDAQPSKESIDAAIGDVLVKPWLPLPLGLKPPSLDSVMSELHKQGIPSIPIPPAPTKTTSGS